MQDQSVAMAKILYMIQDGGVVAELAGGGTEFSYQLRPQV